MVEKPRYVDVNILVYWLGRHPKFGEIAHKWIKRIESAPRGEFVTSSLTIYETLVIMTGLMGKNLKNKGFVDEVVSAITHIKGLVIEPIKIEDFNEALVLMDACNIDYEDSLHLAVAKRLQVEEIVSNDKDFDATPIRRKI